MAYTGYTEARKRASMKYQKDHLEQIAIRVKKGKREEYKQAAEQNGESLAGMVTRLLDAEVDRLKAE